MHEFKDVFISYKAEEFDDANWVKSVLEKNGISCWMAPMCIKGGSSYATEIPRAIRNCKVFVLILSEKAQISKWVPKELDQAINENKIIMPFMLENCSLKDDFNFYLTNVQRYEAYENKSAALEKMISEIKSLIKVSVNAEIEIRDVIEPQENNTFSLTKNDFSDKKASVKEKKIKLKNKFGNKKKITIISLCLFLFIVAAFFINEFRYVSIAEEHFYLNSSSIYFDEPKSLTNEDLEKLKKFKYLSSVNLDSCVLPAGSLNTLLSLNIYSLSLKSCNLSNDSFQGITEINDGIKTLYLSDNNITDISFFANVSNNIENLYIDNNKISDLSFLKGLNLYTFSANGNGIADLSPLSNCINLTNLSLDDNNIISLEALEGCEDLSVLSVNNNNLKNLRGMESSLELNELYAASNNLVSLSGIENATLLEIVNLNYNQVADFSIISKSKNSLLSFYANGNNISDLSFLTDCIKLEILSLDDNNLNSLESINNSNALNIISCSNNRLSDLKGLDNKSALRFADFSYNEISDISAINSIITQDEYDTLFLDLSYNFLSDYNFPKVNYSLLNLVGNNINDFSWLSEYNINNLLLEYSDKADYKVLSEYAVANYYVVNCPKDKIIEVRNLLGEYKVEFIEENNIQEALEEYVPGTLKSNV